MNIAERNRAIKRTLARVFGRDKIKVRGSRGTGYGWVSVDIDYTPLDVEQRQELVKLCKQLLRTAKIDLGFCYTDDTCQYTSDQCHINFNTCRYHQTMKHSDGSMSVIREWGDSWEPADEERAA
jgi:hypothetical protein